MHGLKITEKETRNTSFAGFVSITECVQTKNEIQALARRVGDAIESRLKRMLDVFMNKLANDIGALGIRLT